jgi:hypothetical protein
MKNVLDDARDKAWLNGLTMAEDKNSIFLYRGEMIVQAWTNTPQGISRAYAFLCGVETERSGRLA